MAKPDSNRVIQGLWVGTHLSRMEELSMRSFLAHGHEYLLCERCGELRAIAPAALSPVRDALREALGYEASFTHFPLVALCGGCATGPP